MIDTRAVAQEMQDQLLAAVNRGQAQVRKGREAVTGAIRTGNELTKAFRPNIPALPVPGLRVPSLTHLTDRAKLRASAQELAEQMIATRRKVASEVFASQRRVAGELFAAQRNLAGQLFATQRSLADKAFHAASPLVADSVTRLSKVVETLQDGRKTGHADSGAHLAAVPPVTETDAPAEHAVPADTKPADVAGTKSTAAEQNAKVSATRTAKTASAKTGATAAGASRAKAAKPATPKK